MNDGKMDPKVKEMWLKALRSGEYKQVTGWLSKKNSVSGEFEFCCLGVLCDLWAKEPDNPTEGWSEMESGGRIIEQFSSVLPSQVYDWAGFGQMHDPKVNLPIPVPVTGKDRPATNLASANDMGLKFDQIADIIEAQL